MINKEGMKVLDVRRDQICYLNVSRIKLLCYWHGHSLDLTSWGRITVLPEPGPKLDLLLNEVIEKLNRIELPVIAARDLLLQECEIQGKYVTFNQKFTPANIMGNNVVDYCESMTKGKRGKEFCIYADIDGYSFIGNMDKKWFHKCNSFSLFNSSTVQLDLKGLGFIDGVDQQNKIIGMTPYLIAVASS